MHKNPRRAIIMPISVVLYLFTRTMCGKQMEVQMTKINERVIEKIIMEYAAGEKPTELSRKYGVARSSVYRWLNTQTERDVKAITHLSQRDFRLMLVELE